MASIAWSDVEAIAPHLTAVPPEAQMVILAHANDKFSPNVFGGEDSIKLRLARMYQGAHEGEIFLRRGQGGAVTGETVAADSMSLSYAAPFHGSIDALETTSYGLELIEMISSSPRARMPVTW